MRTGWGPIHRSGDAGASCQTTETVRKIIRSKEIRTLQDVGRHEVTNISRGSYTAVRRGKKKKKKKKKNNGTWSDERGLTERKAKTSAPKQERTTLGTVKPKNLASEVRKKEKEGEKKSGLGERIRWCGGSFVDSGGNEKASIETQE